MPGWVGRVTAWRCARLEGFAEHGEGRVGEPAGESGDPIKPRSAAEHGGLQGAVLFGLQLLAEFRLGGVWVDDLDEVVGDVA